MALSLSMCWLRAAALAVGVRRAAAGRVAARSDLERETAAGNRTPHADSFGCWCKTVDSMSDCADNKYPDEPWRPDGPRWFHAGVPGEGGASNLCCKRESPGFLAWAAAGLAYTQQEGPGRCKKEVRAVPATTCCRLVDPKGSVGVRVKSVRSQARIDLDAHNPGSPEKKGFFGKTAPEIRLEDIDAAVDHDGKSVPAASAWEFVRHALANGRFDGEPRCGGQEGSMGQLLHGEGDEGGCRLREAAARECCCNKALVGAVKRCLPVANAATEEEAATRELKSSVTSKEHVDEYIFEDTVVKPGCPRDETRMPKRLDERPDPDLKDVPETSADEASTPFTWDRAPETSKDEASTLFTGGMAGPLFTRGMAGPPWAGAQWRSDCVEWGKVRTIKYEPVYETRRAAVDNCRPVRRGQYVKQVCTPRYTKTEVGTKPVQDEKEKDECLTWRWQRACPAGQGLYERRAKPGECMGEGGGLERVGGPDSRVYACPAGHVQCECGRRCA